MNQATIRRIQQRLRDEGYKTPDEEETESNPAEPEQDKQQERVIRPQQENMSYRQQEEELLAQYRRELEQEQAQQVNEDEEQLWQCECGHESPLSHNFCGVCGLTQPVDWWCECCQIEQPFYHRFCFSCGTPNVDYQDNMAPPTTIVRPQQPMYTCEASVLTEDNDVEIERAVSRMTLQQQQAQRHHPQPWDEDDDGVTFADDCDDVVSRQSSQPRRQAQQQQPKPQPSKPKGWSCVVCTFHNENDCFLSCEMCGSFRPASPTSDALLQHQQQQQQQQQHLEEEPQQEPQPVPTEPPKLRRRDSGSSSEKTEKTEKKEMRFTDLLQMQRGRYDSLSEAPETKQQPHQQPQQPQEQESEADLELAMIYAQQERMLAEYQNQQRL